MRKDTEQYLTVKNAIISLLLAIMYTSWLVEGLHPVKVIIACVSVFFTVMWLLTSADRCYMRTKKKSAPADKP